MPASFSLNTQQWPAIGASPDSYADYTYVAGEQPIASFDNRAMWNITTDLQLIANEIGAHAHRHEIGGTDEIDLQNLQVNDVVALHGDSATNEYRWLNPITGTSVARIDIDDNVVRQFPTWATLFKANLGVQTGNDITRPDGSVIYDYAADKVEHAKLADHALTADWADVAGALSDGAGGSVDLSGLLRPNVQATITAPSWTFNNTIHADISGNAATADTATNATNAGTADYAAQAGNADTVDGYHAQQLIDEARGGGGGTGGGVGGEEWIPLTDGFYEDGDPSSSFNWQFSPATTYDRYKIVLQHSGNENYKIYTKFRLNGDYRNRYEMKYIRGFNNDIRHSRSVDHITSIGGAHPNETSVQTIIVNAPSKINSTNLEPRYPVVSGESFAGPVPYASVNHNQVLQWAQLESNYSSVYRFNLDGTGRGYGRVRIFGSNW